MQTISAAKGCARTFEFQIKQFGEVLDLSAYGSVAVKVNAADGSEIYAAQCPERPGDKTTRLVTVEGAATATRGVLPACVHWTDENGKSDAEPFHLAVYDHA